MTDLRSMLKRHEGLRLKVYRCPAGFLTIGYGRNLESKGISEAEADEMLANDIGWFRDSVMHELAWTLFLDPVRFDVLVDMAFNLGVEGLAKFKKFLAALEAGDYLTASAEMLDSAWSAQVGDRARELAAMIQTGEYQEA